MRCIHCDAPLVEEALFCNRCGKPQSGVPAPSKTKEDPVPQNTSFAVSDMREVQPTISQTASPAFGGSPTGQITGGAGLSLYNLGYLIAAVGGLLGLLAFFAMPYFNYGFISLTGQQLAGANLGGQQPPPPYAVLWFEPVVAGALVLIAGIAAFVKTSSKAASGVVLLLAGLTLLILLGRLLYDSQPQTVSNGFGGSFNQPALVSFYGSGMWIYMVSMLVSIVGAIVQLRAKS